MPGFWQIEDCGNGEGQEKLPEWKKSGALGILTTLELRGVGCLTEFDTASLCS